MNRRLTLSLHDAPTTSRERGEITTILTAIAVVVLTVGVAIGATFIKLPQKNILRSDAQTDTVQNSPLQGSCTYESFTHIYKESEGIFFSPTEIGSMKVVNDRGGALLMDENERSQRHFSIGEFPFDPTRKANYAQNDTASLTLEGYDRQNWKVKSVFCINRGVQGCPDEAFISVLNQRIASGLEDGARIDNFKVNCDVDVTYGWVLTQSPSTLTPAPTITPAPTDQPTPLPTVASCPYTSTSHVYLGTKGTPLALTELGGKPLTVTNNRNNTLQLNQNSVSTNSFTVDPMPFDPTGKDYYQKGAPASVTLGLLPETYKISSVFCDQAPDSARGCPLPEEIARMNAGIAQKSLDGKTIEGFKVDCNVNVTYGWIVEPQKIGLGSMEVRVEALNYPQKTPIWDKDDIASNKPGSCSRQQSGEQRPLYLNSFKIKATCVSGACSGNKSLTIKVDKRTGYANFTGMTPGEYKLDMVDFDDRGYEVWEPCGDAVWKIEDGKTNQLPVMFLVNLKDGEYEEMPTEGMCKDANGYPNLVEGLNGNVCYFKDGKKKEEPKPDPKPEPDPKPGEGCTALQDGSDGICVEIVNKHPQVKSVQVFPVPIIQGGLAEQTFIFNGSQETRRVRFKAPINTYNVAVRNIATEGGAKYRVTATSCDGGRVEVDKASGGVAGSQVCITRASKTTRVTYEVTTADAKPPKPEPPEDPNKKTIGRCKYDDAGYPGCSVAVLEPYFSQYKNIDPDIVKKMSALCLRENATGIKRNMGCTYTGRNCTINGAYVHCRVNPTGCINNVCSTPELSIGHFQINLQTEYNLDGKKYGGCVALNYPNVNSNPGPYRARKAGDKPYCQVSSSTEACILEVENHPDVAYRLAGLLGKSSVNGGYSFYRPWQISAKSCGFM